MMELPVEWTDTQKSIHAWVELVQQPGYYYPNCWRDRIAQMREKFRADALNPAFLMQAADQYVDLVMYQIMAETVALQKSSRLRYAKRAFCHSMADQHVQERLIAASYFYVTGREPTPVRSTLDFTCPRPFETLEIGGGGGITPCCSGWLPDIAGWFPADSLTEAWTSPVIQKIRQQIAVGDYRSCSRVLCPYFHDRVRPGLARRMPLYAPPAHNRAADEVPDHPLSLHLSYDTSCSLSCPSCRPTTYMAKRDTQIMLTDLYLPMIVEMLPRLQRIWITGSGDPFASKHFRKILEILKQPEHRHITIDMQTNGVLFDAREWDRFEFDSRLGVVIVSLDAGTPETYRVLRRGGNFARLQENLRFLGQKRRQGDIQHLRVDTVVQRRNFREIETITEIAKSHGCDSAYFSIITNWGHLSYREFEDVFVFSADHPDYMELFGIHRKLKEDQFIDWGNLPLWFEPMEVLLQHRQ